MKLRFILTVALAIVVGVNTTTAAKKKKTSKKEAKVEVVKPDTVSVDALIIK